MDSDLEKFLDRVNHDVLMARAARRVSGTSGRFCSRRQHVGVKCGAVAKQDIRSVPVGVGAGVVSADRHYLRHHRTPRLPDCRELNIARTKNSRHLWVFVAASKRSSSAAAKRLPIWS